MEGLSDIIPGDRSRVDVSQTWELQYWSREFGVGAEQIKDAVARVGPMVEDVEEFLSK